MTISERELRLRCLEMGVTIASRQAQNDPKVVVDIAAELCKYATDGSSPIIDSSGESGVKSDNLPSDSEKRSTKKSG
jgi:hypothetical protein